MPTTSFIVWKAFKYFKKKKKKRYGQISQSYISYRLSITPICVKSRQQSSCRCHYLVSHSFTQRINIRHQPIDYIISNNRWKTLKRVARISAASHGLYSKFIRLQFYFHKMHHFEWWPNSLYKVPLALRRLRRNNFPKQQKMKIKIKFWFIYLNKMMDCRQLS